MFPWLPFSRSYGVILPSSLTMVLPFVLEFSSRLPVSVCGTGTSRLFSGFSRQRGFVHFASLVRSPSALRLSTDVLHYLPSLRLGRAFPSARLNYPSVSPLHTASVGGTGFSTRCPSPTPFGLGLGPDLPWADEPSPGNLRLSTGRFLASLSLLMPAFSLPCSPLPLPIQLLPACIAPLPIGSHQSPSFGVRFEPRESSAHHHSTSELLRTLLMCGCF